MSNSEKQMATKYKFDVVTSSLQVIETNMISVDQIGFGESYSDDAKFIKDYKENCIEFYSSSTDERMLKEIIGKMISKTGLAVKPEAPKVPTTTATVVTAPVEGGIVPMSKGKDKTVATLESFDQLVKDGWYPTKKEYREYPMIIDPTTHKILFTCYPEEVDKFIGEGKLVLKYQPQE